MNALKHVELTRFAYLFFISERPEEGIAKTILFDVLMDAVVLQSMTVV